MSTLVGCLCAAILLIVLLRLLMLLNFRSPKEDSLRPSGPSGYPLIGHLNFPSHPPWKTIAQWSKTYHSDIIAYKLFGNDIIFLNSFEAATDLLDKRSAIYSDRHVANLVMLRELCGLEWTFAFQRYGREWRDGRKAFQQEYSAEAIKQYRPSALKATSKFLRRLLSTPDDFMIHVRDLSGERILSTAYGIETKGRGDPWVATSEQVTIAVSATLELGRYWVDFMPILRYVPEWMPGAGFKRQARVWRRAMTDMLHKPFDYVKRRLEDGEAVPDCAAKSLIERNINNAKDPVYWEKIVKGALGSMYGAGTDTTAGTLMSFFLAMAQYPEVQRKAQESIDLVCSGRLPNYSDRERLPYIEAILKECLRWNPVAVFSLNHRCMQDDVYRGYHFSEGTVFIANIWAILHDADTYPDPERFHPERFLTADERKINTDILDPVNVVFGFGRRICPGLQMACETLWLVMVSVLATLEISDAIDDKGIPVPRGAENREGFVSMPKPFSCRIQARTAAHEELLEGAL